MSTQERSGKPLSASERARLFKAARGALRRSYSPYSRFAVSAVLLDSAGELFVGANIENAAYPLGICAERVALTIWRARGGKSIRAAAIASRSDDPTPPCGLCRDALLALAENAEVYLLGSREIVGPYLPVDWLPASLLASKKGRVG